MMTQKGDQADDTSKCSVHYPELDCCLKFYHG